MERLIDVGRAGSQRPLRNRAKQEPQEAVYLTDPEGTPAQSTRRKTRRKPKSKPENAEPAENAEKTTPDGATDYVNVGKNLTR